MGDLKGLAVCSGCFALVARKELINEHELCESCQYEHEAKQDAKTDDDNN